MILSLAIVINLTAALALVAALAYTMSRATRLTPHFAAAEGSRPAVTPRRPNGRLSHRPGAALATARS